MATRLFCDGCGKQIQPTEEYASIRLYVDIKQKLGHSRNDEPNQVGDYCKNCTKDILHPFKVTFKERQENVSASQPTNQG